MQNFLKSDKVFVCDDKYIDVIRILEEKGWKRHYSLSFPKAQLKWCNYSKLNWKTLSSGVIVNHIYNTVELSKKSALSLHLKNSKNSEFFFPLTCVLSQKNELFKFLGHFYYNEALKILLESSETKATSSIEKILLSLDIICTYDSITGMQSSKLLSLEMLRLWNNVIEHVERGLFPIQKWLLHRINQTLLNPRNSVNSYRNSWILKPAALSRGRGILCSRNLSEILRSAARMDFNCVVQKYVEKPLLIKARKFDVRFWVLISSCEPLQLWYYSECYLRFASMPFSLEDLGSSQIHLCNNSVQNNRNAKKLQVSVNEIPENMWSDTQFRQYLVEEHGTDDFWFDEIFPSFLSIAQDAILSASKTFKRSGMGYEWLGFDFMIDENFRVWLIEINVSPDISQSTEITANLVTNATESLITLMLEEDSQSQHKIGSRYGGWELFFSDRINSGSDCTFIEKHEVKDLKEVCNTVLSK